MHQDVARLFRKIDAVRAQERSVWLIRGIMAFLGALVALLGVFFVVDLMFHVPALGLILLWVVVLGGLGGVFYQYFIVPMRQRPSVDVIALRVESRHPELGGRLIAVVQLAQQDATQTYLGSEEIIAALEADASRRALPIAFEEIINWAALRNLAYASGASLVIAILFTTFGGETRDTFLERLMGKSTRYPTRTRIDRRPSR